MAEFKPSTPRLKPAPMQADPDIDIAVGEKGGISLYLGRFPVTLYYDQWERLLKPEVTAEILAFGVEHADLLADSKQPKTKADPIRTVTLSDSESALLAAEIAKCKAAGDMDGAVKYATLKAQAERNGGKLAVEDMIEVYQLKARK